MTSVNHTTANGDTVRSIVHVVPQYPPALGGMETAVHAIVHKQHETGMQVRVITSDQGTKNTPVQHEEFPVKRLKSLNVVNTPIMPSLPFRLLALNKRSIVHLHIAQAYTPELVWLAAKLKRLKYVAHFHADVIPSGRAGILLGPYKKIVLSRVLRNASKVLVPTEDYRDLVCSKYRLPGDRVAVVDNGTNHRIVDQPRHLSEPGEDREATLRRTFGDTEEHTFAATHGSSISRQVRCRYPAVDSGRGGSASRHRV